MWTKIITWLFSTQMGRGVLMGGSIAIGMAIGWYAFSTHYYNEGVAKCQADHMAAANRSNVAQGQQNIDHNKTSSSISKTTDADVAKVAAETEQAKYESKETTRDVYDKPPVTAPVAIGSCVHPLDDRVQKRIDQASASAGG